MGGPGWQLARLRSPTTRSRLEGSFEPCSRAWRRQRRSIASSRGTARHSPSSPGNRRITFDGTWSNDARRTGKSSAGRRRRSGVAAIRFFRRPHRELPAGSRAKWKGGVDVSHHSHPRPPLPLIEYSLWPEPNVDDRESSARGASRPKLETRDVPAFG